MLTNGFDQEAFNEFILENGIIGFFEEPIRLKSGRLSHFYVNWRNVTEDVYMIDRLADFIISFVKSKGIDVDCFFGVPEGATKTGIIVQYKWAKMDENFGKGSHVLPMGRGKVKSHGVPKDRFFVGAPRGRVTVIEDVTTTGSSLIEWVEKLKELKSVENVVAIALTNRMEKRDDGRSVAEVLTEMDVEYYAMSNAIELLPFAFERWESEKREEVGRKVEEYFEKYGVEKLKLM